jgi:glutamyl-tRNA reductase
MARALSYVPRAAIFLAGVAAGALTLSRRDRGGVDAAALDDLKKSILRLEDRLAADEQANASARKEMDARLTSQDAKLAAVPSVEQLTAAIEQLLMKTMGSLDDRLSAQAHSIDLLKTTVSQTDGLLERVLESLDAIQSYNEPAEVGSEGS